MNQALNMSNRIITLNLYDVLAMNAYRRLHFYPFRYEFTTKYLTL